MSRASVLVVLCALAVPATAGATVTVKVAQLDAFDRTKCTGTMGDVSDPEVAVALTPAKFSCADAESHSFRIENPPGHWQTNTGSANWNGQFEYTPKVVGGVLESVTAKGTQSARVTGWDEGGNNAGLEVVFSLDKPTSVKIDFSGTMDAYNGVGSDTNCRLIDDGWNAAFLTVPCPRTAVLLPSGDYRIYVTSKVTASTFPTSRGAPGETTLLPKLVPVPSAAGSFAATVSFAPNPGAGASVGDVTVFEGTSDANGYVDVPIILDSPATSKVDVDWTTVGGAATDVDHDYVANSGTVTFEQGEDVKQVRIPIARDSTLEPDEKFTVKLTGSSSGTAIAKGLGFVTLLNDDSTYAEWHQGTPPDCYRGNWVAPSDRDSEFVIGKVRISGCWHGVGSSQPTGRSWSETTHPAWVGGLEFVPRPGAKLILKPWSKSAPLSSSGAVDIRLAGGIVVPAPPLSSIDLDSDSFVLAFNTAGSFDRLLNLPLLRGASASATVTWDPGGEGSTVALQASLDSITQSLGEAYAEKATKSIGTLSAQVGFHMRNGEAPTLTGTTLELPEFSVVLAGSSPGLKLGFGGAKFIGEVDGGVMQWTGQASILFPWSGLSTGGQAGLTGSLSVRDGHLVGMGFALNGFAVPIGSSGAVWTGINGAFKTYPSLGLDVGVTAESVARAVGQALLKLQGNMKYGTLAAADCSSGSNPLGLVVNGNIPAIEDMKLGTASISGKLCAYVASLSDLTLEAGLDTTLTFDVPGGGPTKLFVASGKLSGWLNRSDFNFEGTSSLTAPVIGTLSVKGVVSSAGYALCGNLGFVDIGFATLDWAQLPLAMRGCDFTPYRVAVPRRTHVKGAAAPASTIRIPAGQSVYAIELRGATGAPRVRIDGPGGVSFTTPAGANKLTAQNAVILPQDDTKVTSIWLKAPAAGDWTLTPLPGSASEFSIGTASKLPTASVTATTKQNSNGSMTVSWKATNRAGRKVSLYDVTTGVATRVVEAADRDSGTVTFDPENPLSTARRIEARVDGANLGSKLSVASYTYKAPAIPAKPTRLTAKRTGRTLAISWGSVSKASGYVVTVGSGGGVSARSMTKLTSVVFSPAPAGEFSVSVSAIDAYGRTGSAATASIAK